LLLYGRFPFDGGDIKEISSKIKAKSYLVSSYVSEFAKSFISKMLQINPADRFTAKQLLKH
jgi:serine/threonine protein kinase